MILYTNRKGHKFKRVEFSSRDFAISSLSLNETIATLRTFSRKCIEINQDEVNRLLKKPTVIIKKQYIVWEDSNILLFPNGYSNKWEALNILYVLSSVLDQSEEVFSSIISANEEKALGLALYKNDFKDFSKRVDIHIKSFYKQIQYFDVRKMLRCAKALDIHAVLNEKKVVLKYRNVDYKGSKGSIFYNEIFIFVNSFTIDGFILRFKDFDYSSYWNLPVSLHPFLSLPGFCDAYLSFYAPKNYEEFIRMINYLVHGKVNSDRFLPIKVSEIISNFNDLRRMWASNKMTVKERLELSKIIVEKKINYDNIEGKVGN